MRIQEERPILHDHPRYSHRPSRTDIGLPCAVMVALCALFLGVAWYVKSGLALPLDLSAHQRIRSIGNPPLTALMHVGPFLGTITVVIVPLTALWLLRVQRWGAGMVLFASVVGMGAANLLLKGVFHRLRPGESSAPRTFSGYLFPSMHTVLTIVTYGLLAYLIGRRVYGWKRTLLGVTTVALVTFVGVSLVYLDTHYCTDVIGGLLVGGAWLIGSCMILRVLETSPQAIQRAIPLSRARNRLHDALAKRALAIGVATAKREGE